MNDANDEDFERWFVAVRQAPEAARDVADIFTDLTDNALMDLLREVAGEVSSSLWDGSGWS